MNIVKKEKSLIQISKADFERAYKKANDFKKLLEKGKTSEDVFKDMLRLISVE
jgi:predicted RNA-binding protein associated with RNAse of E/G family